MQDELFFKNETMGGDSMRAYKIAVAGAGYVGMAMAVLLSLHHQVTVVDIVPEKSA